MTRKIFIWVAHPEPGSLGAGLADAYQAGAQGQGAEIRRMDLSGMRFDPRWSGVKAAAAPLEPDLLAWQENLAWADHLLIACTELSLMSDALPTEYRQNTDSLDCLTAAIVDFAQG